MPYRTRTSWLGRSGRSSEFLVESGSIDGGMRNTSGPSKPGPHEVLHREHGAVVAATPTARSSPRPADTSSTGRCGSATPTSPCAGPRPPAWRASRPAAGRDDDEVVVVGPLRGVLQVLVEVGLLHARLHTISAPCSALCTALVTQKKSSWPLMTRQSVCSAEVAHQRDLGEQQLGHAAAEVGRVQLEDARALASARRRVAQSIDGLLAGRLDQLVDVSGGNGDEGQHGPNYNGEREGSRVASISGVRLATERRPFFSNAFVARAGRWGLLAWSLIGILILAVGIFRYALYPIRVIFPPLLVAVDHRLHARADSSRCSSGAGGSAGRGPRSSSTRCSWPRWGSPSRTSSRWWGIRRREFADRRPRTCSTGRRRASSNFADRLGLHISTKDLASAFESGGAASSFLGRLTSFTSGVVRLAADAGAGAADRLLPPGGPAQGAPRHDRARSRCRGARRSCRWAGASASSLGSFFRGQLLVALADRPGVGARLLDHRAARTSRCWAR